MTKRWQALCALFLATALFGCNGGGGGGGGSGGLTTNIFSTWSSVEPPENVAATGISLNAEYTADPNNPPFVITDPVVSTDSTVSIRYRADGTIERIDILVPDVITLSWNEPTDTIYDAAGDPWVIATDSAESEIGILFNPREMDHAEAWEYQTFGAWATGRGSVSGAIGAMSVGTPTPAKTVLALPFDQDITFTGYSAGIYTISDGTIDGTAAYRANSDVFVRLNFADPERKLLFETKDTKLINIETNLEWTNNPPTLDVTGVLTYDPVVNAFKGNVTANGATGGMNGQSTGQFYGPAAEEVGGVFSLSGQLDGQKDYYSGAYGAARPSVP